MGKPWARTGSWGLASFLIVTCVRAQCTKDLDCGGDQICEDGRCAEPPPAPLSASAAAPPPGPLPAVPSATPAAATSPSPVAAPSVAVVETPGSLTGPRLERRSPALIVVGSLAVAGGIGGLLVGLGSMGQTCHYELADNFQHEHCESSPDYLAYALGSGALVAGAVLIVVGAKRVPVEPVARVAPWLSPQAAGLTLRLTL